MNKNTETFKNESTEYLTKRKKFWNNIRKNHSMSIGGYYRKYLISIYKHAIPKNSRVLEIGCGNGDLLAALEPSYGVGIDFSAEAIKKAESSHTSLEFRLAEAENLNLGDQTFDYIVLSELVNDLWDVQHVLEQLALYCNEKTRIIVNFYSHLWNIPMEIAKKIGIATPSLSQNWLTNHDLNNLLGISNFQPIRKWEEIVVPIYIPVISNVLNRYIAKITPFRHLCLANFIVAKTTQQPKIHNPKVSVVIAARNESGHIEELIERIPKMGSGTEIIFVEGNSTDDTFAVIQDEIAKRPTLDCKLIKQPGKGKGDAVRAGFDIATGDILMILDADITVPPEDLPRFFAIISRGEAEFVNGVRLVYPMQEEAMRFFNLLGNKFFSIAFSWLLGQPIRDTLCGTKVLWKSDYEKIKQGRAYFGEFDPFGDFDLLFGAAKLNLKIKEVPIRYRARRYGDTNISRWSHGWLLLRMVAFAARRIKFI